MKKNSTFDTYSKYYDLFNREKNYRSEVDYVINLLSSENCLTGDLLEFGSGTGGHAEYFCKKGYDVVGIELSEEMISRAFKSPKFSCIQGDICEIKLDKKFDAVISLFHVMSYLTSNIQINAAFQSASYHLNTGGLFVFDFWYSPAVLRTWPSIRVREVESLEILATRISQPMVRINDNIVDVNFTMFIQEKELQEFLVIKEKHTMRHFSIPELDYFAEINGFQRVIAEEFETGAIPSQDTWGVCLMYKKL